MHNIIITVEQEMRKGDTITGKSSISFSVASHPFNCTKQIPDSKTGGHNNI